MPHGNTNNKNAKKGDEFDSHLHSRCYKHEKAAWVKMAQKKEVNLQDYVRSILNASVTDDIFMDK